MENCMHMNSRSYYKAKNTDYIYCSYMRARIGVVSLHGLRAAKPGCESL